MDGKINYSYRRVYPRDLFNESKLLKCLGQLSLRILDNRVENLTEKSSGKQIKIGLHDAGYLVASEISFYKGKIQIFLGTNYNSKDAFPLVCLVDYEEIEVFDAIGQFTQEFSDFLKPKKNSNIISQPEKI